ncbi:MAG TPA: beta-ketoacyl synthase N-terminal-like domain-containing protein, partial [Planctomycetaceae bacterium]|nr:beta-ketoacyl synthase N-terminal-like domain-containing protein [Planctomycetaceae bacterium]
MNTGEQPKTRRRVVVTGVGVVSPLGIGAGPFLENLRAGKSGIGPIGLMSYSAAPENVGGEVREFTEEAAKKTWLKELRKSIKVMCREIQMGVASAALALEHAGLDTAAMDRERFGVDFGANLMFSPPEVLKDACWTCVDGEGPRRTFHYERWGRGGANEG